MSIQFQVRRTVSFWVLVVGIILTSILLYQPKPSMGFILDDYYVIVKNPLIKDPSLYTKIFSSGMFDSAHRVPDSGLSYYRPLLTLSFALDYQAWGLNATMSRWVNIGLHVLNSLLVFWVWVLLFKRVELAGLAAIIFCIHPAHEWVVRYIVGRGDLLQAFFSLLSMVAFIQYLKLKSRDGLWLSLVFFAAALLSREVSVLNVFYLLLVGYVVRPDIKVVIKKLWPFGLVTVGYFLGRAVVYPVINGHLTFLQFSLGIKEIFVACSHVFFPALIQSGLSQLLVGVLCIVLGCSLWILLRDGSRFGLRWFGLAWFAVGLTTLLVTQKAVARLGPVLSEHFLYFSLMGFTLMIAAALLNLKTALLRRILFVGVCVYFLGVGFINSHFWQNEQVLLRYVQYVQGQGFTVADEQLAMRYSSDVKEIQRLLAHAQTPSSQAIWLKRLGSLYRQQRQYPQSIQILHDAVQLNPQDVEAWNELGVAYWQTGQMQKGFAALDRSLGVDARNGETYRLLGTTFYIQGKDQEAQVMLKQALIYDPDDQEAASLLQNVLKRSIKLP